MKRIHWLFFLLGTLLALGYLLGTLAVHPLTTAGETRHRMDLLFREVQRHADRTGAVPADLDAVVAGDEGIVVLDAWNRPITYTVEDPQTVAFLSYGADGAPGGVGENADIRVVRTVRIPPSSRQSR